MQEAQSYQIKNNNVLQLRAFLFRNGSIYAGDRALGAITEADIEQSSRRSVGKGASGTVFLAQLKGSNKPIALKQIPITSKPHRDEVDRELSFFSSRGENPFVMQNLGAYWDSEENAIVLPMEWMAYTLKDLNVFWVQLAESVLRDVFFQVVSGLAYLHDVKRLIHRDLKPSNILIRDDGYVKIGDFGVSKLVQTLDVSSTYVGTMHYMAPERLEQGNYSFSSDVWSLGLTVISTVSGKNPWSPPEEIKLFDLIQKISGNCIPTLPESSNFSSTARDFVERCLQRNPDARPSCKELLQHPFFEGVTEASATNGVRLVVEQMTRMIHSNAAKAAEIAKSSQQMAAMIDDKIGRLDNL